MKGNSKVFAELSSPGETTLRLAHRVGMREKYRIQRKWTEGLGKELTEDTKLNYGFTIICNSCGSTRVGMREYYYEGEYGGTDLVCSDCGER